MDEPTHADIRKDIHELKGEFQEFKEENIRATEASRAETTILKNDLGHVKGKVDRSTQLAEDANSKIDGLNERMKGANWLYHGLIAAVSAALGVIATFGLVDRLG